MWVMAPDDEGLPSMTWRVRVVWRRWSGRLLQRAKSSSINAYPVAPQSIRAWDLITLELSWSEQVAIMWMPSISLGSTKAEVDNRKRDEDSVRPLCVPLSAHGTTSFPPVWERGTGQIRAWGKGGESRQEGRK